MGCVPFVQDGFLVGKSTHDISLRGWISQYGPKPLPLWQRAALQRTIDKLRYPRRRRSRLGLATPRQRDDLRCGGAEVHLRHAH